MVDCFFHIYRAVMNALKRLGYTTRWRMRGQQQTQPRSRRPTVSSASGSEVHLTEYLDLIRNVMWTYVNLCRLYESFMYESYFWDVDLYPYFTVLFIIAASPSIVYVSWLESANCRSVPLIMMDMINERDHIYFDMLYTLTKHSNRPLSHDSCLFYIARIPYIFTCSVPYYNIFAIKSVCRPLWIKGNIEFCRSVHPILKSVP